MYYYLFLCFNLSSQFFFSRNLRFCVRMKANFLRKKTFSGASNVWWNIANGDDVDYTKFMCNFSLHTCGCNQQSPVSLSCFFPPREWVCANWQKLHSVFPTGGAVTWRISVYFGNYVLFTDLFFCIYICFTKR